MFRAHQLIGEVTSRLPRRAAEFRAGRRPTRRRWPAVHHEVDDLTAKKWIAWRECRAGSVSPMFTDWQILMIDGSAFLVMRRGRETQGIGFARLKKTTEKTAGILIP